MIRDEVSIREAFGEALYELTKADDEIYCIGADTTKNMGMGRIEREMPDRCCNVGICEQNAALVVAGMAACGAKAFVGTYAPFASMRMLEQIRTFCAYPNLNVKVVSGMSGITGGPEGVTHQGTEDLGLLRCIPNIVLVTPADACSARAVTRAIAQYKGPVYLRLGRAKAVKVFHDDYAFEIGKANVMRSGGTDVTIIFAGAVAYRAIQAYEILTAKGRSVDLIEMPCVKPIDAEAITESAKRTGAVVTVEDNNIIGGLGSGVAEVLCENYPALMKRIGLPDCFAESGEEDELMDKYGMSVQDIVDAAQDLIGKKAGNVK